MSSDSSPLFDQLLTSMRGMTVNKLAVFEPYPKQWDFIELGKTKRERLFMAGNQVGKSMTGAFELACHLTGLYPKNWRGKKFDHAINAWCAGEGGLHVRDIIQQKLIGGLTEFEIGKGMLPKDTIAGKTLGHGVAGSLDSLQVKHVSGGISTLGFKSYDQGRGKFQGATLHVCWCDEEPPADIYSECLARLTTGGIIFTTATPLQGLTAFIERFTGNLSEAEDRDRGFVRMGLNDAVHFPPEERARRLASFPPHERRARAEGEPMLGAGQVFYGVTPESLECDIQLDAVPQNLLALWGMDYGQSDEHPFAAVLCATDPERDLFYVLAEVKVPSATPREHASLMMEICPSAPVAWPHDVASRDANQTPLKQLYKGFGLHMLSEHAQFPDGSNGTEAGVQMMWQAMRDGRFFVNRNLSQWFTEFRGYHRKPDGSGQIVKVRDDLMSATRMGYIMRRKAQLVPFTGGLKLNWGQAVSHRRKSIVTPPRMNPFTGQRPESNNWSPRYGR